MLETISSKTYWLNKDFKYVRIKIWYEQPLMFQMCTLDKTLLRPMSPGMKVFLEWCSLDKCSNTWLDFKRSSSFCWLPVGLITKILTFLQNIGRWDSTFQNWKSVWGNGGEQKCLLPKTRHYGYIFWGILIPHIILLSPLPLNFWIRAKRNFGFQTWNWLITSFCCWKIGQFVLMRSTKIKPWHVECFSFSLWP